MVVANVQRIRGKMDIVKKSTEEMAEWLKENKFGPKTVQAFLGKYVFLSPCLLTFLFKLESLIMIVDLL